MTEEEKQLAFEKLVQRALKHLGPKADRDSVEKSMVDCGIAAWLSATHTKAGRASLANLEATLRKLSKILKTEFLPPLSGIPSHSQVDSWVAEVSMAARRRRVPDAHWLGFRWGVGYFERYCALQAYKLLKDHEIPAKLTKGGVFERLTACLACVVITNQRRPVRQFNQYCRDVAQRIREAQKA
jgi:hypothetical protein